MKISPFAGLLLAIGGVVIVYYIFKPRKAAATTTTPATEPTKPSTTLTQAEANAIAKKASELEQGMQTMQFPTGSQKLIAQINESGYQYYKVLSYGGSGGAPKGSTGKALKTNFPIVYQVIAYLYSDGKKGDGSNVTKSTPV